MAGVYETYAAALQHDRADLPEGTRKVGVVRRPMGWFHGVVDENHPDLGPQEDLLEAAKAREDHHKANGRADAAAVEQAWADTDFAARYRAYLDDSVDAQAAMQQLLDRVRAGTDVALVCYEADDKPCHRHLLRERLIDRLEGSE